MRIKKSDAGIHEGDLTPMIDMTFQLIAFFMVLINFSQNEQNDKVKLPESELAKPPEGALEFPVTLHLMSDSTVIIGDQEVPIAGLRPFLIRESNAIRSQGKEAADATIIIRADRDSKAGKVQELIQICQENEFEKFALRAKEDVGN
jgi:biopolymer transport protein ExbD